MAPADSSTQSFLDRVHGFVSDNRRAILIGTAAAAIAVGGAAAYYASTSSVWSTDTDSERRVKDKKKGGKPSKKRKPVKDKDGPIIEEISPKEPQSDIDQDVKFSVEEIAAMSEEERIRVAADLKTKGNNAYQQRKFSIAADFYSNAIMISPKPEAVFYSNRAACHINMLPPNYEQVIEDCDAALALDKNYVKALNRRGAALEKLDRNEEALRDFTAATILNHFRDDAASQSVERVLKTLSSKKAAEILAARQPSLPSTTFVSAYFAAFRARPHPALPETPTTGDETLRLALEALDAADYPHALTLVNEALEQGISWTEGKAEALNLRGTFKFLTGDSDGAKADLEQSLSLLPSFTQSLVKIASVHMEQGNPTKTFQCFEDAITQNPDDPDIYYHRGQVHFIMGEYREAATNYTKSTALDDKFVFSHIQLAVAQYKSGEVATSMATFRRTLRTFPSQNEPYNYYGELLLDQQRFQDAVDKFERAMELEKARSPPPPINVLPLVNKGLAIYQWKQDIAAAEKCCLEALEIDPECEAAVATLGQLSLQGSRLEEAVKLFWKQAELARSEAEMTNALTYHYASAAQVEFLKSYPELAGQLVQIARQMA